MQEPNMHLTIERQNISYPTQILNPASSHSLSLPKPPAASRRSVSSLRLLLHHRSHHWIPNFLSPSSPPPSLYLSASAASIESITKECSMAYSQKRDFLFCNYCGTMLNMESIFVTCPLCKFKRNAKEVAGKEISYTVTAEDIRRELGLSLFDAGEDNNEVQWSKVKKACEKCQNPEMHYTTRQTRSADEGQTTHYLCPRCGYQCQES